MISNWRHSRFITRLSPEMLEQIALLKQQEILKRPKREGPSFVSRMFLVKKSSGSVRLIFDLRGLNAHVRIRKFQLISHYKIPEFLQDNDYMTRIDIAQAYFHVPIAENHQQLLRLVYNRELLQMTSLPFGLSSALHTFAAITNWVAEILCSRGMKIVVYLDDFLLASQNRDRLDSQTKEAVSLLESLGWHVNHTKCVTTLSQEIEFLGVIWNTCRNRIILPEKKVQRITKLVTDIRSRNRATLKQVQCLLDLLNFANFVVQRGRLHCRYLQRFCTTFSQRRLRESRSIPRAVDTELQWWCKATTSTSDLHKRESTHFLTTDAADTGWGAQLNGFLSGNWPTEQKKWHSNRKEMYAVYASINQEAQTLRKAHILLQTDNRTLVAYIQKEGGTKSLDLLNFTFQLLRLVDSLQIELSAAYLPGRYNGIADRLSRKKTLPKWHLPKATNQIFKRWGVPDIDLFASAESAVVERYVSRDSRDRCAYFIDAFSRP